MWSLVRDYSQNDVHANFSYKIKYEKKQMWQIVLLVIFLSCNEALTFLLLANVRSSCCLQVSKIVFLAISKFRGSVDYIVKFTKPVRR